MDRICLTGRVGPELLRHSDLTIWNNLQESPAHSNAIRIHFNSIKTKSAGKMSNLNDRGTKIPRCLARSVVFVVTAFANIIVIYDDFRI